MTERPSLALRLEAFLTVTALRAALWLMPFRWWRGRLTRMLNRPPGPVRGDLALASLAAGAVERAARLVPRASCLVQALALRRMLERRGAACDLRLGVARSRRGDFEAHAWIESGGKILIGAGPAPRFKPLAGEPGPFEGADDFRS
jgi:hypothetical protein